MNTTLKRIFFWLKIRLNSVLGRKMIIPRKKDGSPDGDLIVSACIICDQDGKPIGIVLTFTGGSFHHFPYSPQLHDELKLLLGDGLKYEDITILLSLKQEHDHLLRSQQRKRTMG